jgi:hypothetical protein
VTGWISLTEEAVSGAYRVIVAFCGYGSKPEQLIAEYPGLHAAYLKLLLVG